MTGRRWIAPHRVAQWALAFATALAALPTTLPATALPTQSARVAVGDVAPDFTLRTPEGTVLRLSDLRGKQPVVLVFFRGVW